MSFLSTTQNKMSFNHSNYNQYWAEKSIEKFVQLGKAATETDDLVALTHISQKMQKIVDQKFCHIDLNREFRDQTNRILQKIIIKKTKIQLIEKMRQSQIPTGNHTQTTPALWMSYSTSLPPQAFDPSANPFASRVLATAMTTTTTTTTTTQPIPHDSYEREKEELEESWNRLKEDIHSSEEESWNRLKEDIHSSKEDSVLLNCLETYENWDRAWTEAPPNVREKLKSYAESLFRMYHSEPQNFLNSLFNFNYILTAFLCTIKWKKPKPQG